MSDLQVICVYITYVEKKRQDTVLSLETGGVFLAKKQLGSESKYSI